MKRAFSLTVWVLTLAKTAAAVTSTSTWTGGDGSYTNVANWSPAVVPNNLNGSGTSYVARIDGDNARAVSVRLDPFLNVALEQLIVTTGDSLTIANGSSLYVLAGASVTGTLALTGGNDATSVYFLGAQSLAGSGQILMGGNAPNANFIHADNGGILTVAPGITIHGTGGILGNSAGLLLNQGTITADLAGRSLNLSYFQNEGKLIATNSGSLILGGMFRLSDSGTLRSIAGGTISIQGTLVNVDRTLALSPATGSLFLDGGTIRGGKVTAAGDAQLLTRLFGGGILDDTTLEANLTVTNGCALAVVNGLTNNAVLVVASDANTTAVSFLGTQTLGGSGQILLAGTAPVLNSIRVQNGGTLTIGPGITIHGAGNILGDPIHALVNQGTIRADVAQQPLNVQQFVNQGHLEALDGGWLSVYPALINVGTVTIHNSSELQFFGDYVQTAGATLLTGGHLRPMSGGSTRIEGGSLLGAGYVDGVVTNGGALRPGSSAGVLAIGSNLTLTSSSLLQIELGARAPGSQDVFMNVADTARLDGSLVVSFLTNYNFIRTLSTGASFILLTAGAPITGTFTNLSSDNVLSTSDGFANFTVSYSGNKLEITLVEMLDNDADGIPNWWTKQYFGHLTGQATDSSRAGDDADGDGLTNLQEYLAGSDPKGELPAGPRITAIAKEGNSIRVTWSLRGGTSSSLQRTAGPAGNPLDANSFVDIFVVSNPVGSATNYLDVGAVTNGRAGYYRVRWMP